MPALSEVLVEAFSNRCPLTAAKEERQFGSLMRMEPLVSKSFQMNSPDDWGPAAERWTLEMRLAIVRQMRPASTAKQRKALQTQRKGSSVDA